MNNASSNRAKRTGGRLRWWHWLGLSVAVVALAVLLSAWWVYRLWQSVPAHWQQNQSLLAHDPQAVGDLAAGVERRMLEAVSAEGIQNGEHRQVVASFDEINAWLATNFDGLLAHAGLEHSPFEHPPMVTQVNGRVVVAGPVAMPGGSKIISLHLDAGLSPDGLAYAQLRQVQINRLTVPVQTLFEQLQDHHDSEELQASGLLWLTGQAIEPVVPHPGNARLNLRLVNFHLTPQGIDATLQGEPRSR